MPERRRRVGVVGGGVAGVATAFLLDEACDCVLFEATPRIGGHAHSVTVDVRGEPHVADLGAQFYGPLLHPWFTAFLAHLGVYAPAAPDSGGSITRAMGTTLMGDRTSSPRFVSPLFWSRAWPVWAPSNGAGQLAFLALALAARRFERDGDWSVPLHDWLRTAPGLSAYGRERVVLPWLAALVGCSIEAASTFSARAALSVPGRAIPANLVAPFRWSTARLGLQGVVEALIDRCTHLTVRRGAPVEALVRTASGWRIHGPGGPPVEVDDVVVAVPPYAAAPLVAGLPGGAALAQVLRGFPYFRTRMVLHTDPVYMHQDRRMWSAYNAIEADGWCEGSAWYGAIRDPHADGGTVDLFKSWATGRAEQPREVLAEADYQHPLLTPAFLAAQRQVAARQGEDGLWFAGSWTRDVDLQETALRSAFDVVVGMGIRPRWAGPGGE